jgi:pimeloyl-ACP methyl ester carboxylesterase
MNDTNKVEWDRVPIVIRFVEAVKFAETYGFSGSQGMVALEGQQLKPPTPSDTVYIFMHPSATLQLLPMPQALADAGMHVICAGSRYPKNDSALILEKVAVDLGQYVRHARENLGYAKVILVGWSGGGSLSLFYQSQAEAPTITQTPAGDEYDLTTADLPSADGVIFIAAHLSRAETLTEWLDPSVEDELNPDQRNPELDIYASNCPHRPPFPSEFVAHFRAAQVARNRRITAWVDALIERLGKQDDGEIERAFVVHRTMCDVRWIDPQIDPNGRKPNWTYLGDPRVANSAPAGLGRYTSLRSWLSQWSYDRSQAKGADGARRIRRTPVLQIENQADDAVPASHNPLIHSALNTTDKEMTSIHGATHYYAGQPEQMTQCINTVIEWSRRKKLLA